MRPSDRSTANSRLRGRWFAVVVTAAAIAMAPSPATAEGEIEKEEEGGGAVGTFFLGMTSGLLTLVYTPLKVVYATAAIPLSGVTYLWSVGNSEMATRVMRRGTQGTFVLTPEHLTGAASLDFLGAADEGPPEEVAPRNLTQDY
ncbi:MAG: hypothetical protein VX466_11275 [Myxococcota bacterium]|nr:hypothetical protein [Myxococcota bacterium]